MVEPPVVHVVPHVGAAIVRGAPVRQRGEQLRRAVIRRVLKRINQTIELSRVWENELVSDHEKPSSTLK